MSSNKDKIDCPCSGTCVTVGQGWPDSHSGSGPPYGIGEMGTVGTALSELSGITFVVNTPELALPDDYPRVLADLKAQIRSAQWTAARVVNTQVIELYWAIGKAILDRQNTAGWGAKVIDQLAVDLSLAFPGSKGFSRRNLHYMRRLVEAWPGRAFVQQPAAQMPWDT